jgi:hypothetical protein
VPCARAQTTDQTKSNAGTGITDFRRWTTEKPERSRYCLNRAMAREFIGFPVFRRSSPLKNLCCKSRHGRDVIFGSFHQEKNDATIA